MQLTAWRRSSTVSIVSFILIDFRMSTIYFKIGANSFIIANIPLRDVSVDVGLPWEFAGGWVLLTHADVAWSFCKFFFNMWASLVWCRVVFTAVNTFALWDARFFRWAFCGDVPLATFVFWVLGAQSWPWSRHHFLCCIAFRWSSYQRRQCTYYF